MFRGRNILEKDSENSLFSAGPDCSAPGTKGCLFKNHDHSSAALWHMHWSDRAGKLHLHTGLQDPLLLPVKESQRLARKDKCILPASAWPGNAADEPGEAVHLPTHPHAADTGILLHLPDFQKDFALSLLNPEQPGMEKALIRHGKLCFLFPNLVDGEGKFVLSVRKLEAEPVSRNFSNRFQGS